MHESGNMKIKIASGNVKDKVHGTTFVLKCDNSRTAINAIGRENGDKMCATIRG